MPTKEDLQKIIDQFDESELKERGFFGISQYGGGSDESFIRANKEGLELFALELLKSARDMEDILSNKEKKEIWFDDIDWFDENSDTFIHYIEPVAYNKRLKKESTIELPTFIDKLIPYGCGFIFLVLLLSILVGVSTMFKWFFN